MREFCFVDVSGIPHPLCTDCTTDANRLVKVRGIIVDGRGLPTGHPIASNRIISNTLMLGASPVNRNGTVTNINEPLRQFKRKSASTIPAVGNNANPRESIAGAPRRLSATPATGASTYDFTDFDMPITYQIESYFDWSTCKPGHRQSNTRELGDGLFAVEIAGEPVVWIFSRNIPNFTGAGKKGKAEMNNSRLNASLGSSRSDSSRAGAGFVYLIEIHYYLRLETGQV